MAAKLGGVLTSDERVALRCAITDRFEWLREVRLASFDDVACAEIVEEIQNLIGAAAALGMRDAAAPRQVDDSEAAHVG